MNKQKRAQLIARAIDQLYSVHEASRPSLTLLLRGGKRRLQKMYRKATKGFALMNEAADEAAPVIAQLKKSYRAGGLHA